MSLALDNLHLLDERKSPESYIDPSTAGFAFDPLSSIDIMHYAGEPYGIPSTLNSLFGYRRSCTHLPNLQRRRPAWATGSTRRAQ